MWMNECEHENDARVPMATKTARGCTANIPKFRVAKATAPHRHVYTSPHCADFFWRLSRQFFFDFQTSLCATNRRMLSHCHVLEPHHLFHGETLKPKCVGTIYFPVPTEFPAKMAISRLFHHALYGKSIFRHWVVLSFINQVGTDTVRKGTVRAKRSTPKVSDSARSFPLYIRKSDYEVS